MTSPTSKRDLFAVRMRERHFHDKEVEQSEQDHCLEQIAFDLAWALGAAQECAQRNGSTPMDEYGHCLFSMGGRRWARFKTAIEQGKEDQAKEMKNLAQFCYSLSATIEHLRNKARHGLDRIHKEGPPFQ